MPYLILMFWITVPLAVGAAILGLHQLLSGRRAPQERYGEPLRSDAFAWLSLVFSVSALVVDGIMLFLASGSNSDMAGAFLYAGAPLAAIGGVFLAISAAARVWRRAPLLVAWSAITFAASLTFVLATPRVWALIY